MSQNYRDTGLRRLDTSGFTVMLSRSVNGVLS